MTKTFCLDFGNTRKKAALFQDEQIVEQFSFDDHYPEAIQTIIKQHQPHRSILSSVVQDDPGLEQLLSTNTKFHKLGHPTRLSFTSPVSKPETIGADRLALADISSIAAEPRVTVFTTRNAVDGAKSRPWFGTERARRPSVAEVRLSSPYDRSSFSLVAGDWGIDTVQLLPNGLNWPRDGQRRDVLIYVHGFNQSFQQATLDAARLADGVKFRGETIVFTWPSREKLLDYIHDRDSAMWSRDALENMLAELIRHPAVNNIHLVAHSMGTMVSVEALRQIHARFGETAALKMGAIVLASPDIVKVVATDAGRALYFSRAPIPFLRDSRDVTQLTELVRQHIGVYAYRRNALLRWVSLAPHPLELVERLEQLRALAHGISIGVFTVDAIPDRGIDTEEDLVRANARFDEMIQAVIT